MNIGHYSLLQWHSHPLRREGRNIGLILVRPNKAVQIQFLEDLKYFFLDTTEDTEKALQSCQRLKEHVVNKVFAASDLRGLRDLYRGDLQVTSESLIFRVDDDTFEQLFKDLVL